MSTFLGGPLPSPYPPGYPAGPFTDGETLIGDTATGALVAAALTAGSNVTITDGAGRIEISASGGGGGGGLTLIDEIVVSGSSTTSVMFSSIPNTYTHLQLVCSVRSSASVDQDALNGQFNGDTGNNYDFQVIYSNGGSAPGGVGGAAIANAAFGSAAAADSTSEYPSIFVINIGGYAQTTLYKSAVTMLYGANGTPAPQTALMGTAWRSTAAIASIEFFLDSGDAFAAGSIFSLYGLS
jgi:hypothetical protein